MALAFKITSGTLKDKIYKITPGLTLGRNKADLNLEDRKASSIHASVQDNQGALHLVDLDSRNGLFQNGERVISVALTPGAIAQIGLTYLEVIDFDENDPELQDPLETWRTILTKFNRKVVKENQFSSAPIGPLNPALKLNFIQGRQLDTSWVVGYGPRKFGFLCKEFSLLEPTAPGLAFEIYPHEGAWFKTDHPEIVLLNGSSVYSEQLCEGDRISIGETVLQVQFIKE